MTTLRSLFESVYRNPKGVEERLVLADFLEESGQDELAMVYRWAALHGVSPFPGLYSLIGRKKLTTFVWDIEKFSSTDVVSGLLSIGDTDALEWCCLGGMNKAYRRLLIALKRAGETPEGVSRLMSERLHTKG